MKERSCWKTYKGRIMSGEEVEGSSGIVIAS